MTFIRFQYYKELSSKLYFLSFFFLTTLRISSCDANPPMVRTFEYTTSNKDALRQAQVVFEKLGYKISTFDEVDNYFTTELQVINRLLRPIYYVIYVTAQDRLSVVVYSEVKTFMRASRLGLAAGTDQIMQDASNNLGIRFQRAIFTPITEAMENLGFAIWDRELDGYLDDLIVKSYEEKRLWINNEEDKRIAKRVLGERLTVLRSFEQHQDKLRLNAMEEAEHNLKFWKSGKADRSGIAIAKKLEEHRDLFDKVFNRVLTSQPEVEGTGTMHWVIGIDGRVVELKVTLDTSANTPETELRDGLVSALRSISFNGGRRFLRLRQGFSFTGSYHNLKVRYGLAFLTGQFGSYPITDVDIFADTLFVERQKKGIPIIIKN